MVLIRSSNNSAANPCYPFRMDSKQQDDSKPERLTQAEIQKRMEAALRNKRIAGHKGRGGKSLKASMTQHAGISRPAMKKG